MPRGANDDVRNAALLNSGEMPPVDFQTFGKIARFREMVVTEKIDGTNAAVGVVPFTFGTFADRAPNDHEVFEYGGAMGSYVMGPSGDIGLPTLEYFVYAQSRNRLIAPGKQDNAGFAGWVNRHALELASVLGAGLHFGEWWGEGIQRKYGMDEKRFSLFNTARWNWLRLPVDRAAWVQRRKEWTEHDLSGGRSVIPEQLGVVPEIFSGPFSTEDIDASLRGLEHSGSYAARQCGVEFTKPEGVVAFLPNARVFFKKTLGGDGGKYAS